ALAPDLQRADLRQRGLDAHLGGPLAGDDGLQGRQLGEIVVDTRQLAGPLGPEAAGREEPEAHRPPQDQREVAVERLLFPFRRAARHHADGLHTFTYSDVVRARTAAADAQSQPTADERIGGRAPGYREV